MLKQTPTPRLKDIAKTVGIVWNESKEDFYTQVKAKITSAQTEYVRQVFSILDTKEAEQKIKDLWSKIEPLIIVDENDVPYKDKSGWWSTEFRKDFWDIWALPESKEKPIFCRIALFVIEDNQGNIIVSRRSMNKSHPGELEMAGWHVTAGDSYLETIYREVWEELKYIIPENSLTEESRLFKYRNFTPWENGNKWKGNILTVYNIQVPSIDSLKYDPEEISELIVLTKQDLFEALSTGYLNGEEYKFASNHAYRYLEFLEQNHGIDTKAVRQKMAENGVMKNRTKMQTFWDAE